MIHALGKSFGLYLTTGNLPEWTEHMFYQFRMANTGSPSFMGRSHSPEIKGFA